MRSRTAAPSGRKALRQPLDTRARIGVAALRVLETEGPEAVTMRRIARALRITPMAIYNHYPSREALLRAVTDAEFAKLGAASLRLLAQRKPGDDLLRAVDAYVDYAFARPQVFDYVFSRPRFDARRFPEDFRAGRSPTLNPVANMVAQAMARGQIASDDIWEVALQLWAHAHGYVALYRAGRFSLGARQFRALYHRAVRRLLEGLNSKPSVRGVGRRRV